MKSLKSFKAAIILFAVTISFVSNTAMADTWSVVVQPMSIASLPIGNFNIFSNTAFANGCGIVSRPFQVVINSYGVTVNGVKGMHATTLTAMALGKSLTIHYYENDDCKVDAITITN